MTIRSKSFFAERMAEIRPDAIKHRDARAKELSSIAKDLHRNAPRRGTNKNRFGEFRSAPGDPPAMETGELFAKLDQGVTLTPAAAEVVVNYTVLEMGTLRVKPRQLGRKSSAELQKRAKEGQ